MALNQIVFIVDDDPGIRESLLLLLSSYEMHAVAFDTAAAYLAHPRTDAAACLILDLDLPDIDGLELQSRLSEGDRAHIVFISGHGDIPTSVRAMKAGAVDFLTKPFDEADLMRAVNAALVENRDARLTKSEVDELRRRLSTLTPRERDVLPLIASGLLNKQAATALGISEVTLQIHRGKVMKKMRAASLADLVRMAGRLEIPVVDRRSARG